jgi:hypothetical protein
MVQNLRPRPSSLCVPTGGWGLLQRLWKMRLLIGFFDCRGMCWFLFL